jgi:hypothetical protein
MSDSEVVQFCGERGIDAVVSFNHRDFGKKKALYADLLGAGVSVVVLRPPKQFAFTPERQAALILQHFICIEKRLADAALTGPILLRLSPSECKLRTLADLEEEFSEVPPSIP